MNRLLVLLLCVPTPAGESDRPATSRVDKALIQIESAFGEEPPADWEARLAAWEKTPEGIKEMKVWRSLK